MSPAPQRTGYHHGDLANALLREGLALAREGGPAAVVLREATRRAGVSPNAAYRHFTDRDELLAAVRAEAERALAEAMQDAVDAVDSSASVSGWAGGVSGAMSSPSAQRAAVRLRASGAAYLHFAGDEPGLFATIFSGGSHLVPSAAGSPAPPGAADHREAGVPPAPLRVLSAVLAECAAAGLLPQAADGDIDVVAWSAVHGLAALLLDGHLGAHGHDDVNRVSGLLLDVVVTGLAHLPT